MVEVVYKKSAPCLEEPSLIETTDLQKLCDDFKEWLKTARTGEKYCYYRGTHVSGKRVGALVSKAYENGVVTMYQSREGKYFHYWAQRR